MREELQQLLIQLRLQGMAQALEPILAQAQTEALPVSEALRQLLLEEWRHRQERSLAYRLADAARGWPGLCLQAVQAEQGPP